MRTTSAVVALLGLLGCGGNVTGPSSVMVEAEPAAPTWRQDRTDLLNWFLGHHPENLGVQAIPVEKGPHGFYSTIGQLSLHWEGGQHSGEARYVKSQFPDSWEHYRWDAGAIYLAEDHQQYGANHNSYQFTRATWCARRAHLGDGGRDADNLVRVYKDPCIFQLQAPAPHEWLFSGQGTQDFGGDVGVQDYITLDFILGSNVERFWYTWEWGWIRHQAFDRSGMFHDWLSNRIMTQAPIPGEECRE